MVLVCVIVFSLMRIVPSSAVDMVVYQYQKNGQTITYEEAEAKLGLDKPAIEQFFSWMGGLVQGDMGKSLFKSKEVSAVIRDQMPVSIELGVLTLILTSLISIPLGLYCASHQGSLGDNVIRVISVALMSFPIFWIGTLVLVYPAIWWGYAVPLKYTSFFVDPVSNMRMFLVPALVGAITQAGLQIRAVRTVTLDVMRQDFVRTARAKGAKEGRVMYMHALRNSMIPIITMIGGSVGMIIGGNVILENMFNIPGIGQQMVSALNNRDYPLAQGCTVVFAVFVMVVNLIVDIAYKWFDPRVSLE
jgi:peptide/nickel transport system permease protein